MLSLITQSLQQIQRHEHTFIFSARISFLKNSQEFFLQLSLFVLGPFRFHFHFSKEKWKNCIFSSRKPFYFFTPKSGEKKWKNLVCYSTSSCIFDKHVRVWERKSTLHFVTPVLWLFLWTKNLIKIPFFEIDWKISLLDLKSLSFQFHFFFKKWNQNVFTVHFSKKKRKPKHFTFFFSDKSESIFFSLFTSRSNSCP